MRRARDYAEQQVWVTISHSIGSEPRRFDTPMPPGRSNCHVLV
jgi:hypothetical protein